jgi:NitT/TauT family transport system substrate-binding protein
MRLFVVVVPVLLVGCSHPNGAPSLPEIRVALLRDTSTLPVRLAQVLGYAQQEGISLSISDTTALSKAMEALLGRSVDVASSGLSQAIQLAAEGRTSRCFINFYTKPTLALVVAPAMAGKIRNIRDLKGRRVGIASPGSATHQVLNYVLALNGLRLDDVSTVSVGTAATSIAALGHGKVDAAILGGAAIPIFERKYPNTMILADTRTAEGAQKVFGSAVFPTTGLIAQDDWLKTNAGAARSLVRAVKRAMHWMSNHSANEIRDQMPESLRMEDMEADLMAIRHTQNILSDGAIPPESPELVRKWLAASSERVRVARIDLAKTYTNEFVEAANQAGLR